MRRRERETIHKHLNELHSRYRLFGADKVKSFYPPEMESEQHLFAITYSGIDAEPPIDVGDSDYAAPMQSISKVFTYGVALEDNGRDLTTQRIGVEPSGEEYNAYTFEQNNRPFNAMVNAGALVAAEMVAGKTWEEKVDRIVERLRIYAGNPDLHVDQALLEYELGANDRNLGLSYLMRSLGMLRPGTDIEENLAVYLSICSIRVTTKDLAAMGATLAHGGINPVTKERALQQECVRDVLTVMFTCGMYDAAGQWAYDVGLPAKSGVSGALLIAVPNEFGMALFSPGLDSHGNSVRAVAVCTELSTEFGVHLFAAPWEDQLRPGREA